MVVGEEVCIEDGVEDIEVAAGDDVGVEDGVGEGVG